MPRRKPWPLREKYHEGVRSTPDRKDRDHREGDKVRRPGLHTMLEEKELALPGCHAEVFLGTVQGGETGGKEGLCWSRFHWAGMRGHGILRDS